MTRHFYLGAAGCLLLMSGCINAPDEAEITVHLSVDLRDGGRADQILVAPATLHFHVRGTPRAAAWRGEALSPGSWVTMQAEEAALDLTTLEGRAGPLAHGLLPSAQYDHVFLQFVWIKALDSAGQEIPIADIVEPIALDLRLHQLAGARIQIDLVVMDAWPEPDSLSVFVKHAALIPD